MNRGGSVSENVLSIEQLNFLLGYVCNKDMKKDRGKLLRELSIDMVLYEKFCHWIRNYSEKEKPKYTDILKKNLSQYDNNDLALLAQHCFMQTANLDLSDTKLLIARNLFCRTLQKIFNEEYPKVQAATNNKNKFLSIIKAQKRCIAEAYVKFITYGVTSKKNINALKSIHLFLRFIKKNMDKKSETHYTPIIVPALLKGFQLIGAFNIDWLGIEGNTDGMRIESQFFQMVVQSIFSSRVLDFEFSKGAFYLGYYSRQDIENEEIRIKTAEQKNAREVHPLSLVQYRCIKPYKVKLQQELKNYEQRINSLNIVIKKKSKCPSETQINGLDKLYQMKIELLRKQLELNKRNVIPGTTDFYNKIKNLERSNKFGRNRSTTIISRDTTKSSPFWSLTPVSDKKQRRASTDPERVRHQKKQSK